MNYIRRISGKRESQLNKYRKIRKVYLADKECAVVVDGYHLPGCKVLATQVHHAKGRMGDLLTDVEYFIPVCDGPCHGWLEEHPHFAMQLGLTLSRMTSK